MPVADPRMIYISTVICSSGSCPASGNQAHECPTGIPPALLSLWIAICTTQLQHCVLLLCSCSTTQMGAAGGVIRLPPAAAHTFGKAINQVARCGLDDFDRGDRHDDGACHHSHSLQPGAAHRVAGIRAPHVFLSNCNDHLR